MIRVLAAAIAFALAACASDGPGAQRGAGDLGKDTTLTARVKSAIATDVGARTAAAINVETFQGTVQLTGFAGSREQAERAAAAAQKVQGVRSVKNDVRVKSSS
jgi:hyperosmotically inducible periplasmic protein